MEPIERPIERQLSFKEQQTLLDESYSWAQRMLKKFSNRENSFHAEVPATTHEAIEHKKYGTLIIDNLDDRLYIDLDEKTLSIFATEPNTAEHYILEFTEEDRYILAATGRQIDPTHVALLNEEDEFGVPVNHTQAYSNEQYHAASPSEIQRFADLMLLGGGGFGEMFDAERFEEEFQKYVDHLGK